MLKIRIVIKTKQDIAVEYFNLFNAEPQNFSKLTKRCWFKNEEFKKKKKNVYDKQTNGHKFGTMVR